MLKCCSLAWQTIHFYISCQPVSSNEFNHLPVPILQYVSLCTALNCIVDSPLRRISTCFLFVWVCLLVQTCLTYVFAWPSKPSLCICEIIRPDLLVCIIMHKKHSTTKHVFQTTRLFVSHRHQQKNCEFVSRSEQCFHNWHRAKRSEISLGELLELLSKLRHHVDGPGERKGIDGCQREGSQYRNTMYVEPTDVY